VNEDRRGKSQYERDTLQVKRMARKKFVKRTHVIQAMSLLTLFSACLGTLLEFQILIIIDFIEKVLFLRKDRLGKLIMNLYVAVTNEEKE